MAVNEEIHDILSHKGIKPTPNRILVLKELLKASNPVNLADLEIALAPMDKASIFRVLELFSAKEVTHVIEDGSRSLKYELCRSHGDHDVSDQHAHFYCEKCGKLFCLDDVPLPHCSLPEAFLAKSVNLTFKGICAKCASR